MIGSSAISVHPFYRKYACRLDICPGKHKHPVDPGYADRDLRADHIDPLLQRGVSQRYCWLLGHNHLIIDVDVHNEEENGYESLQRLNRHLGIDVAACSRAILKTPTGGLHICFAKPAELRVRSIRRAAKAVDLELGGLDTMSKSIRNNALVIAAGSTHPTAEGVYEWYGTNPELVMAPQALLDFLSAPEPRRDPRDPNRARHESPLDDFQTSWEGVQFLADRMHEEYGYTFNFTSEEFEGKGQDFYEFQRPGKASTSHCSGYLGKKSREGNHQLTCFSLADEFFESGETVTITEALCRLENKGKGVEGEGGHERYKHLLRWLREKGFGRLDAEQEFGGPIAVDGAVVSGVVPAGTNGAAGGGTATAVWPNRKLTNWVQESNAAMPLSMPAVLEQLRETPLWTCNGTIFVQEPSGSLTSLPTVDALFGYLRYRMGVSWRSGNGDLISRGEFAETLTRWLPQYDSIQATPHFPPLPGVWYVHDIKPDPDPSALYEFVDHFKPASDLDRELMIAAIVTPFWGQCLGGRPMFTVVSDDGVGSGKSTFVRAIARLAGMGKPKMHPIRNKEGFKDLPRMLGSQAPTDPTTSRIITIDNYKGQMLGGQDLESMLTEEVMTVWKLYHGGVEVPNTFVWYITGNFINMSEDLAQRSVEIRILKPEVYSPAWSEKLANWDVDAVLRGIAAWFELKPAAVTEPSRFGEWCSQILGRLQDPDQLVATMQERVADLSIDEEDGDLVRQAIEGYVYNLSTDGIAEQIDGHYVLNANRIADYLNRVGATSPNGQRWTARYVGVLVRRHAKVLPEIHRRRTAKRKFYLWIPVDESTPQG